MYRSSLPLEERSYPVKTQKPTHPNNFGLICLYLSYSENICRHVEFS